MDFSELEAIEGLRWSWHSWPVSKPEASSLVIPLSIMFTPLMHFNELPILPYEPLRCSQCSASLNPYSRVDYATKIWFCSFCFRKNPFSKSYANMNEDNIPAELFPTYSTVEYRLSPGGGGAGSGAPFGSRSNSSNSFSSSSAYTRSGFASSSDGSVRGAGPAFVFVVDCCSPEEELRALKNELLHVVSRLPDNALVGLVVFDAMVRVYDLGFTECLKVFLFHGDRHLTSDQVRGLLGLHHAKQTLGNVSSSSRRKQGFLVQVSESEFGITTAIDDLCSSPSAKPGHRPLRSTGAAVSVAVGLLEGCSIDAGSRIMVFSSGPATLGPGKVVDSDLGCFIRTHRDLDGGYAPDYKRSREFYEGISRRLCESSIALDLFACALDQVGAAEFRVAVERSGGVVILGESFGSEQFGKCLRRMFGRDGDGNLRMFFDATIEIVTTRGVKICGALGPCASMNERNDSVSDGTVIGEGATRVWKLCSLTDRTSVAFFFEVANDPKADPPPAFLVQFTTSYRCHGGGGGGDSGIRKRVTTVARRWAVGKNAPEVASGFDQETAAAVIARLAVHRMESDYAVEVVRWLDRMLIRFAAKFGDYVPEDPSSFRLPANFSLFPQFVYYLRRSQFVDVFNTTPDETAYSGVTLNREGVVNSLVMVQPTLFRYSFDGPPVPVLLDVCSVSPDAILLFDSFFHVVIHYGSKVAQWRKMGYDRDPSYETFRKLLEAPEADAEQAVRERVPVPKLIRCDQHSSQARFLVARLNPSVTQNSIRSDGKEIVFTDDVSLQVFIEHLKELAVQG
ncbi:hypothetical protein M569_11646 [Genlisea aurea]|uniref:Protein transport protein SEC23 n=1 Tax=Genlisea aurea TaxID=192259 RepID=S8DJT0_9LAMI|nr:hypothetical protein M569_11646 [Genlisea aurea]